MEVLNGIRVFGSTLKYVTKQYRCLASGAKLRNMLLGLNHLPNIENYWFHFNALEQAEDAYKKNLFNELISECGLKTTTSSLENFQKEALIRVDIETLRHQCFISDGKTITEGFLSCLEQFPYDDKDSVLVRAQAFNRLSIKVIRDVIERQYLSWKLKCPQMELRELFWRYRASLYPYRSITNMRRNLIQLESVPELQDRSVAEKIYFINQKPFDIELIRSFEGEVVGLSWHVFRHHCPKTLIHSHQYIVFTVSVLKDLGFSEVQIQNGLQYLYLKFRYLLRRLNNLLGHPELSKFRNEDRFLGLLFLTQPLIRELIEERKMSYEELLEVPNINKPKRAVRLVHTQSNKPRIVKYPEYNLCNYYFSINYVTVSSIFYLVSQFYTVSSDCATMIKRHPKYRLVSERQIHDTLQFLKENDFTSEEVEDSICIIFYPRELIEEALVKIKMDEAALRKIGLIDGRAPEKTLFFQKGTKEKRKTLQLCLYYIEKPHNFSGDGVWMDNRIKSPSNQEI